MGAVSKSHLVRSWMFVRGDVFSGACDVLFHRGVPYGSPRAVLAAAGCRARFCEALGTARPSLGRRLVAPALGLAMGSPPATTALPSCRSWSAAREIQTPSWRTRCFLRRLTQSA